MPNVLIVDDKEEGLYFLQCLLSSNGFQVSSASNGQQALECAERILPDLVISDILMPVMDGFTLCRHFKKDSRFRAIPFIFYTATYTDARDEEFALSIGADLFVVKPKDPAVLMQIIRDFLENRTREVEPLPQALPLPEESDYLQSYNSALVRKLEKKVLQLEEANRSLAIKDFAIATSIAGIIMADLSGTITYVNDSFADMWGCKSSELVGKPFLSLAADEYAISKIISTLRVQGHWIGELKANRKTGPQFTVQIAAHTVTGPKKDPICFMASCVDITEHKRLQEEIQRNQNLEALSTFAAGIAHDFNNLLTGLFNNLDLAKEELQPGSPAQEHFAMAISVFERARDLAQSLLTFAKGGNTVRRPVSVPDIIRESCALSLSGSSIRCEIFADGEIPFVEANANQLSQVFTNIVINARQAMEERGTLRISVDSCRLRAGEAGTLPEGQYVAIRFEDSGPGIPESVIARIFDPFFSTKPKGSGLGLATSYSIVKNHGGHIQASTRISEGAVFEIWLPAGKDGKAETVQEIDLKVPAGSGRILVMDDEEAIRHIAQTMLARAGYEVTAAGDGNEVVHLYREALSADKPYDLVILDLTVRGGMGGSGSLGELLKIHPGVVAIASTGYSNSATLSQLRQSGFAGLLPKPYSRYELLSVVKSALGSRHASGQA